MQAVVLFNDGIEHPLSRLLRRGFRHVWCALQDADTGVWIGFDWAYGHLKVSHLANDGFDLAQFYRERDHTALELTISNPRPHYAPLKLNNCVGHTKQLLGLSAPLVVTPWGLHQHLTQQTAETFDAQIV